MAMAPEELQKKLTTWKTQAVEIPVRLETQLHNFSSGVVYYKEWSAQEKLRRGGKTLGILWGLAVISVFIPIAHFVLVPLFLIAGPIGFAFVFNSENSILGGIAPCPDCKQEFDIVKSKVEWPQKDICSHCRHSVIINKI